MFKPIHFHFKEFFFYIGLLMGIFFLVHNLLLIQHYQLDRQLKTLEKEFVKLSLEERKLRSQKNLEIGRDFEKERDHLEKYSIKDIPLVEFENP